MFTEEQLRILERRIKAACCDAVLWGGCWLVLQRSFSRPAEDRPVLLWGAAAAVLLLVAGAELFTGVTPGKWLTGLRVRRADGTAAPITSLLIRGSLRLLPLAILLLALPATSTTAYLIAFTVSGTIATCFGCAAYLTFIRHGLSPFDLASKTQVTQPDDQK
jgi:uncharacterized RDD family membrane protein YckC